MTTSRLLSTGVDAQTCRLIVLDRPVGSMTEFKQILGRGTRVHEDTHKYYFTLMDFRGATRHFADPDFDGEPVQIYDPDDDDPIVPPDDRGRPSSARTRSSSIRATTSRSQPDEPESRKFYVNGVLVTIIAERVKYLDADGKLITESLRDYSKRAVTNNFASLDTFLQRWKASRPKASDHRGARGGGAAARAARRRGQPRPRPVRPHLPRRLRPAAADPPRAGRQRPQARRVRQVRPAGAGRARRPARRSTRTTASSISAIPASCRSRRSIGWAPRSS